MSEIVKTTIALTIIHPKNNSPENMSLQEIAEEMDLGEFIGQSKIIETIAIDPEKIAEEEIALGGDGTFFAS